MSICFDWPSMMGLYHDHDHTYLLRPVLLTSWDETEWKARWSWRSWLQQTESSVAAWESQSTGSKTEQAQEEGDMSDQEQRRFSSPSVDNFCWVQARRWTPSCVCYMSQALSKVTGCRWGHWGRTWWEGSEVGELRMSQRWDMDRVRP